MLFKKMEKMSPKQRITSILNKKPHDCLSWTVLIDNNTLDLLPDRLKGNYGIDFYRYIKCDILLLNGWNTPYVFRSPELHWSKEVTVETFEENEKVIRKIKTKDGDLTSIYGKNGHPLKYMIDSRKAIKIYTSLWKEANFVGYDDSETLKKLENLVGEDGVITRFWGPSTIPRLLEMDMGTVNFYYLLYDYPSEMENLINTIHKKELEAFKILSEGPCNCVILVENTSTHYISPQVYKTFNMPHQQEFVEIIKNSGKTAILHMCGHIRKILHLIKETGCDGIHALTPPPTGDTPWEIALDILGQDTIIISALDPSVFLLNKIDDIPRILELLITKRLKESNFILGVFADGIKVEPERFCVISQWVEQNKK